MATRHRQSGAGKRAVKDWRATALQLHVDGWTLRDIAKKVGRALSTVHDGIEAELAEITRPFAEAEKAMRERLRDDEGMRLLKIIRGHITKASKGDAEAAHVVIAASRQRGKLYGLEAPTRTEHSGKDGGPIISVDLSKLTDEQIDRFCGGDDSVLASGDPPSNPGSGDSGETPPSA